MRKYLEWVTRNKAIVIGLTVLFTVLLGSRIAALTVIVDTKKMEPWAHPYTRTAGDIERIFGNNQVAVIGITAKQGDVFQPNILAKVKRINDSVADMPLAIKPNILSLAAFKARSVEGTADGMIVQRLMDEVPKTPEGLAAVKRGLDRMPVYKNAIISEDGRTTAIIAQFRDPTGSEDGFKGLMNQLRPIVDRERDASVEITIGGAPPYLSLLETYSQRIGPLFLLALLITGLIHYEAFRTAQGLILPLVTALIAVVWALGAMSLGKVPLDIFNATTPILILAVAAGHAVQILKRYYEEYNRLLEQGRSPDKETSRIAVVESVHRIAPVMLTAGIVAAMGFLSLLVFEIPSIRTFGVFTAFGILSALVLELSFIPALRAALKAPSTREQHREKAEKFWNRLTSALARLVLGSGRRYVYATAAGLVVLCAFATRFIKNDNDLRTYFSHDSQVLQDDRLLNSQLGGTNSFGILVEGKGPDAIKDPRVLKAMDATQRYLESQPGVGKTLSIVDFIKRMNVSMNADDPAFNKIPDDQDTVAQFLLLYGMSGDPGDFDTYVDYGYQNAHIWMLFKSSSSLDFEALAAKVQPFVEDQFRGIAGVRVGGNSARGAALNQVMVDGKLRNILQITGVLFVLSALVFRSLLAGLLVLVPLAMTTVINFGILGLTGIPLNISNAITTAMGVGIGADYAIYMIFRLREELAKSNGEDEAAVFHTVFGTAGKAVLFVASAIAGGYGVLMLSVGFYMHIWMGILIAASMIVSSISALTLLPSLILTLRPKFIFRTPVLRAKPAVAVATGVSLLVAALGFSSDARAADLTAQQIMEKNFTVSKVSGSVQDITMELINSQGQKRVRRTFSATKLQPNGVDASRVVKFLSPTDIRGTATLLVEHSSADDDIWVYLPALKKVRRLVASNKKDSFAGTDFSYGDIIGHKVQDFQHKLVKEEKLDGADCYVIESVPANDNAKSVSGYSKRQSWIAKNSFVMLKSDIWDSGGKALKQLRYSDVKQVDPANRKWMAMNMEASNLQTGHKTVIRVNNFKLNAQIEENMFSTRYLEQDR